MQDIIKEVNQLKLAELIKELAELTIEPLKSKLKLIAYWLRTNKINNVKARELFNYFVKRY